MVEYGLVYFPDERAYDVVKMSCVVSHLDRDACVGSEVQVRWRDKGLFEATLIDVSEDKQQLIRTMEEMIAEDNKSGTMESKKNREKSQKKQAKQLLADIKDTREGKLQRENASLKRKGDELEVELKKYRKLDGYLKTAEKLLKHLHCQACGKNLVLQEYEVASDTEKHEAPRHDGLGAGAVKGEMTALSSGLHFAIPESSGAVCKATLENTRAFPAHSNSQHVPPVERNNEQRATRAPQPRSAARGPSREAEHAPAAFRGPASMQLFSQSVPPVETNSEQPATRAPQARSAAHGPSRAAEHAPAAFSDPASTQLLYSWSDANVVELQPGSSVYVQQGALWNIETTCKTATATARSLLTAIYTQQALLVCSVKGHKAKGLHRPSEQRPPLHFGGIAAILAYTKDIAQKKGWEYSEKIILLSMGTKLSELRSEMKKQQQVPPGLDEVSTGE